jgi:hypothetical protein
MTLSEHLRQLNPTRRALLAAGTVTLAISMALSIAPAMAAGNPNAGTVKVHDVSTNTDSSSNDPHVCTFTVVFQSFDADATGSWTISQTAPTGSDQVAGGTYTVDGNGADETAPMTLPAGHYSLDWTADAANGKHKTFWVDDSCASQEPGDTGNGSEQPGDIGSGDGTEDPGNTGDGSEQPGDTGSGDGTEDPGNIGDGSEQPGDTGSDQSGHTGDQSSSGDQSGQTPEGAVQGVTGSSKAGGTTSLPNTSFDPRPASKTPLLTVLGLLLLAAAHPFIRRSAHADRA